MVGLSNKTMFFPNLRNVCIRRRYDVSIALFNDDEISVEMKSNKYLCYYPYYCFLRTILHDCRGLSLYEQVVVKVINVNWDSLKIMVIFVATAIKLSRFSVDKLKTWRALENCVVERQNRVIAPILPSPRKLKYVSLGFYGTPLLYLRINWK